MKAQSENRPWGSFNVLCENPGYKVKSILVKPQQKLSLQSHKMRAEHWVVVQGIATVTVNEDIMRFTQGEYIYIPLGAKHRLENLSAELIEIIEVQIGDYLGEDDIVRYDDIYSRLSEQ
ncbi:MAG: phosphomannose isomerase type II C-terminal cupin domain [Arenicella sp.]